MDSELTWRPSTQRSSQRAEPSPPAGTVGKMTDLGGTVDEPYDDADLAAALELQKVFMFEESFALEVAQTVRPFCAQLGRQP